MWIRRNQVNFILGLICPDVSETDKKEQQMKPRIKDSGRKDLINK
jgi:hypothetical protein